MFSSNFMFPRSLEIPPRLELNASHGQSCLSTQQSCIIGPGLQRPQSSLGRGELPLTISTVAVLGQLDTLRRLIRARYCTCTCEDEVVFTGSRLFAKFVTQA